jgi:hypothetical protein
MNYSVTVSWGDDCDSLLVTFILSIAFILCFSLSATIFGTEGTEDIEFVKIQDH